MTGHRDPPRGALASVQRWETTSNRAHSQSLALLATIHVRAGEPDGPQLADRAITAVTRLRSTHARKNLLPLAAALTPAADGCRSGSVPGSLRHR